MPNGARDGDGEDGMIILMRDMNWMARQIEIRENDLRQAIAELSESRRLINEKNDYLLRVNLELARPTDAWRRGPRTGAVLPTDAVDGDDRSPYRHRQPPLLFRRASGAGCRGGQFDPAVVDALVTLDRKKLLMFPGGRDFAGRPAETISCYQ